MLRKKSWKIPFPKAEPILRRPQVAPSASPVRRSGGEAARPKQKAAVQVHGGTGGKRLVGYVDVAALKSEVGEQWLEILRALAPDLEDACNAFPKHVPCPMHGGKDGFRLFDDAEATGGGICNTCGAFHDGISLLRAVNGWSFREATKHIRQWLDNEGDWSSDDEDEPGPGDSQW